MELRCNKCEKEWEQVIDCEHLIQKDGEIRILCDDANCPGQVYLKSSK
jgi:hypothetical protein